MEILLGFIFVVLILIAISVHRITKWDEENNEGLRELCKKKSKRIEIMFDLLDKRGEEILRLKEELKKAKRESSTDFHQTD